MKYFSSFFLIVIFLLGISSCSNLESEEPKELEEIPEHFVSLNLDKATSFSYPKEMIATENLRFESKFQFSDLINVQYVVVQENDKENELKYFAKEKLSDILRKMEGPNSNKLTAFQLSDINGFETNFETDMYGWPQKLVYWISIVELKNKFITTITWTTIDRRELFKEDAELIIKSFRVKD